MLDSGDLRYDFDEGNAMSGACAGDGSCYGYPACPAGQKVTNRVVLRDPLFSRLGCAPAGPNHPGASCALIDDPEGAYDDCAYGAICVAGTCHALCGSELGTCDTCGYVEGVPPELTVCL